MGEIDFPRIKLPGAGIGGKKAKAFSRLSRRLIQPGLRANLVFLVTTIALFSIIAYTFLLYHFQSKQLIENAQDTTAGLSSVIETSLEHALAHNDRAMVTELIESYGRQNTIERLRIINNQGQVTVSSNDGEAGRHYNLDEPVCQMCHAGVVIPAQKTTIYTNENNERSLLAVNIIYNQLECQSCHASGERILGLLMVETPLSQMQEQLNKNTIRTSMFAIGTVLLLVGLMVPMLNRFVFEPLDGLSKGVSQISAGNLDCPVKVATGNELGQLAESFNGMRLQLKTVYQEMEHRERQALTLYELGTKISASLALNEVLDEVAEASRQLLDTDIGLVALVEKDSLVVVIEAVSGDIPKALKGQRLLLELSPDGNTLVEGDPLIAEVYDPDQPLLHTEALFREGHTASFLAVPLQRGDQFLGVIEVMSHKPRRFISEDAQLLMRLANQVVVSIENAQLHRKFRYLAILEERNRLAREMHDHLAQTLGYLNVKATITDDQLNQAQLEQAQESLHEMKLALKGIYIDVREAIFKLRTSISSELEFLPTLREFLNEYQVCYGLKTQLMLGSENLGEISAEAGCQVLFIVQEALTNVRKHAQARKVIIQIRQEEELMKIEIQDDGYGFDIEKARHSSQSYGLNIMRERAESVGGVLKIDTQLGGGTRIKVSVPSLG
jgi:two-component system, NarL family, nitrate/nitrite sensor histidine kinase NarX